MSHSHQCGACGAPSRCFRCGHPAVEHRPACQCYVKGGEPPVRCSCSAFLAEPAPGPVVRWPTDPAWEKPQGLARGTRERLHDERPGYVRTFRLPRAAVQHTCPCGCGYRWEEVRGPLQIYAVANVYPDGRPGELFLYAGGTGSTSRGTLDAAAIDISIGLQSGVPLATYLSKMVGTQFGPAGLTGDKQYRRVSSAFDAVARWLRDIFPEVDKEISDGKR